MIRCEHQLCLLAKQKWVFKQNCVISISIYHKFERGRKKITTDWTEIERLSPPPAPCVPTHLTASMDCDTGITGVSWDSARGAESYTVFAHGSLDHNATCSNTDSNCYFSDLACGQNYDITVVAHNQPCDSLVSDHTNVTSGNKTLITQIPV